MKKTRCFLDMDGVLADFEAQAQKMLGFSVESFKNIMTPQLTTEQRVKRNKLFHTCDYVDEFWSTMPAMRNALQLYNNCQNKYDEVFVLSRFVPPEANPERLEVVRRLKKEWFKKHIDPNFEDEKIIVTDLSKEKFIDKNNDCILIDDMIYNCAHFEAAGGKSILYTPEFINCDLTLLRDKKSNDK